MEYYIMAKNVLVLIGSPRHGGNTELLCDEFIRGAETTGANVKKIFIQDYDINYCMGCSECYKQEKSNCLVFDDDMKLILDEFEKADVIVFASPVYFYTITGQIKTVIDRMTPRYQKFIQKDVYMIVLGITGDEDNLNRAVEDFRGFLDCMPGPVEKGVLKVTGVWNEGDVKDSSKMKEAYGMGAGV